MRIADPSDLTTGKQIYLVWGHSSYDCYICKFQIVRTVHQADTGDGHGEEDCVTATVVSLGKDINLLELNKDRGWTEDFKSHWVGMIYIRSIERHLGIGVDVDARSFDNLTQAIAHACVTLGVDIKYDKINQLESSPFDAYDRAMKII